MNLIGFSEIGNAILIGLLLSVTLGPTFFILIKTSITKGFRAAVSFDLGVIFGDIFLVSLTYFLAYLGSGDSLSHLKENSIVFFIGGTALLSYGLFTYFNKDKIQKEPSKIDEKKGYVGLFFKGFLLNFINVLVWLFWIATMAFWGPHLDMNIYKITNFFAIVFGFYFCVDLGKISLAKQLSKKMTPKNIIKIKKITGIGLVLFGIILFVKGGTILFEKL